MWHCSSCAIADVRHYRALMTEPVLQQVFRFGRHLISHRQIFLKTKLSYAFTNRKPILPGHILVSTRRVVARFADLSPEEVSDLFLCAHRIAPVIQREFKATSLTVAVQDGSDAGQTVEHVHVHMIPRRPGDFRQNDEIYDYLEKHDSKAKEEGPFRSSDEMESEARQLAALLRTNPHQS